MFVTIPMALTFLLNRTRTGIATSIQTPVSYRHNTSCDSSALTVCRQSDFTTIDILLALTFLPVDHSRVILKVPDENGSDYINASYIEVGTGVFHSRIGTVLYH